MFLMPDIKYAVLLVASQNNTKTLQSIYDQDCNCLLLLHFIGSSTTLVTYIFHCISDLCTVYVIWISAADLVTFIKEILNGKLHFFAVSIDQLKTVTKVIYQEV